MSTLLRDLVVLAIDCQASGTTPAHGDVIDIGWALCDPAQAEPELQSSWIVPRTERPVRQPIRELTGWSEDCLAQAVPEQAAWSALLADVARLQPDAARPVPTAIHYARFELPFLRDLYARLGGPSAFPFDAICVHAIATRLFPDLPKHNIRALAGFLGHSPGLVRRAYGHVEATAFIWRALVPRLERAGIGDWEALRGFVAAPAARAKSGRRTYALEAEQRRALPDLPGVYRFLRRGGDVIYVGKATSLKKRVAGHFKSRGRASVRSLELLSQVHELAHTVTDSLLEAALLETDEIKRFDPPYNVQLRAGERQAWFAARDYTSAVPNADAAHPIGPLPSERALAALPAFTELLAGAPPSRALTAIVLAVPGAFLPEPALFAEGFQTLAIEIDQMPDTSALRRVERFARALFLQRGRKQDSETDVAAPDEWDLARVRRRLERSLVQAGLLARRARFLTLLADANLAFREQGAVFARGFSVRSGAIVERSQLESAACVTQLPAHTPRARLERQRAFDAGAYDRMRVLLTELRRIQEEGGEVALALGRHVLIPEAARRLMRPL